MSDHASRDGLQDSLATRRDGDPVATETIEAYPTDDGIVLFDAENPMAWVEATQSYSIEDVA